MATTINPSDQTITQYNVQTGAASNLLNNVAPSATSGVPLISQGSSAQPIFGTTVVAGGGTGDTSFTAYSVITGGTTSTGALQQVSGVGTNGQVLTSAGAGALPTWQAIPASGGSNATLYMYEDFLGLKPSSYMMAGWKNIFTSYSVSTPNNPGITTNADLPAESSVLLYYHANNGASDYGNITLGGGAITCTWIINPAILSNSTNRYKLFCGLSEPNAPQSGLVTDAVYFEYSDNVNSGNWIGATANSAVVTTANSAVAATTAFTNLTFVVNAAGTSVAYYVNGTQIANSPISTNIPSLGLTPFVLLSATNGTVAFGSVLIDMFSLTQTLTTPR